MGKIKELDLKIGGMHCAGCASGIEKGLSRLEGVMEARVNFALGTASVDYDPGSIKEESIIEKGTELGYHPKKAETADMVVDGEQDTAKKSFLLALVFTIPIIVLSVSGMFVSLQLVSREFAGIILLVLTLPVLLRAGRPIFADGWNQTRHFRANMNSLIALGSSVAFLYSTCMVADVLLFRKLASPHYYFETSAMIITLILFGRYLESRAGRKARDAIGSLLRLRPERATLIIDGDESEIDVSVVRPGMIIMVKPGGRIAADVMIIEGEPSINESLLTGESMPVEKN
ncbi:MAG: cation-translocating P-type ATPase, partial [Candidatus Zixiibacteriota bacterium]